MWTGKREPWERGCFFACLSGIREIIMHQIYFFAANANQQGKHSLVSPMKACYRAAWLWFSNLNCQVINASSETQGQPIDESTEERIEYTHWFNWMPGMYTWCGNSKPLNDLILNAAISLFLKYLEAKCRIWESKEKRVVYGISFWKCGIRTPIPFHTPYAFRQPYSSLHVQEFSLHSC